MGRDQITCFATLNGDGETDFYENFNNDAQVTEHFHEFAMDLQVDAEGNFYYGQGRPARAAALVPHHGTLLKVAGDGTLDRRSWPAGSAPPTGLRESRRHVLSSPTRKDTGRRRTASIGSLRAASTAT